MDKKSLFIKYFEDFIFGCHFGFKIVAKSYKFHVEFCSQIVFVHSEVSKTVVHLQVPENKIPRIFYAKYF